VHVCSAKEVSQAGSHSGSSSWLSRSLQSTSTGTSPKCMRALRRATGLSSTTSLSRVMSSNTTHTQPGTARQRCSAQSWPRASSAPPARKGPRQRGVHPGVLDRGTASDVARVGTSPRPLRCGALGRKGMMCLSADVQLRLLVPGDNCCLQIRVCVRSCIQCCGGCSVEQQFWAA
jgi:hypothetical protein